MRKDLITWARHKDGSRGLDPNFLMACKFEGFDEAKIEKGLKDMLNLPDNPYNIYTIIRVFERKRDQARLVIWNDHEAKLVLPTEPYWVWMDEGRNIIRLGYGDEIFIFEDEKAGIDKAEHIREILKESRIRADWKVKLNEVTPNRVWLIDFKSQEELLKKSSEQHMKESESERSRNVGDVQDERLVEQEEEKDLEEFDHGLSVDNYDYGKALAASRIEIGTKWGRGFRDVGGTKIRFKFGRMYNTKTSEYLIAPGLNFGPDAWWQYKYYGTPKYLKTPQEVINRLANLWKENIIGTYSNRETAKQYDTWLSSCPELRIGIKDDKGVLIEKKLRLERREVNPKTGEEYTHVHYCMNGYRVPKARWATALFNWLKTDIPQWEFDGFLKQMGKYTMEMLVLPGGRKEVAFSVPSLTSTYGEREKFAIKFNHRLNEGYWNVYSPDLMSGKKRVSHEDLRRFLGKLRGSYNNMADIVTAFADLGVSETDFMQALQVRAYRRAMREQKSEDLLKDVASQFPDRVTYHEKEQCVIVIGKLRAYKININEKNAHGMVTVKKAIPDKSEPSGYKDGQWICVVEDSRQDTGIAYDRVVSRVLLLMNDEEMAGKVGTLRR